MAHYLKNKQITGSDALVSSIGSANGTDPLVVTSPINLGTIEDILVTNSIPETIIYADASGILRQGTFGALIGLPAFSSGNIILGPEVITGANVAVQLTDFTSVTSAINLLNDVIERASNSWRRYEFDTSLKWIVEHNMNTTSFVEVLTDSNGKRFQASINIVDANSFEIELTSATAGIVDVNFDLSLNL